MAKLAQLLSPAEQFDMLRAFGFGNLTGVGFPSESRGTLRPPDQWQPRVSRASIAMGYEFDVTPLQLAAAYGVIANDGILLMPTLVREIRSSDGETVYRHQPEPIRRAVTPLILKLKNLPERFRAVCSRTKWPSRKMACTRVRSENFSLM